MDNGLISIGQQSKRDNQSWNSITSDSCYGEMKLNIP